MAFEYPDAAFIGTLLSQLFLGVYITVFGLYVKIARLRKAPLSLLDYGLVFLFVLCVIAVVLDAVQQFHVLMRGGASWVSKINSVTSTLSLTLDFVSQVLLIFRCWTVWGQSAWISVLPGFLSLSSYVTGLCVTIDLATRDNSSTAMSKSWWVPLGVTSMSLSLAVNTIVSALMISRIMYVHRQNHRNATHTGESSGKLAWVAAVFLESAIALFVAQLVYLVLYKIEHPAFALVAGPVTIIYGLNCTAIMVRVGLESMGSTHHSLTTIAKSLDTSGPSSDENYRDLKYTGTDTSIG